MTSTYNQNVGREASSGRKLKGDTTTNQGGGIRENSAGTYIQGAGEANHINDVRNIVDKPERNEEKGAPNIKIAALTDTLKGISYSLVKHSQIQQLKKINDGLLEKDNERSDKWDKKENSNGMPDKTDFKGNRSLLHQQSRNIYGKKRDGSKQKKPVYTALDDQKEFGKIYNRQSEGLLKTLNRIKNDLGDARGCTEHKHQ
jgi:hypothetical protein